MSSLVSVDPFTGHTRSTCSSKSVLACTALGKIGLRAVDSRDSSNLSPWECQDKSWEDRTEHANTKRRKEDWMPKRQESANLSYVKVEPARRNASWRQFWFQIED